MPHIVSTLSNDQHYTRYHPSSNGGAHLVISHVKVKGGANVANPKALTPDSILTPEGVTTKVSDDELEFLLQDEVFLTHQKNGFVKVLKFEAKAKQVAKDMAPADNSAPLTEKDSDKGGRIASDAKPVLNSDKK